jgi:transposase
MRVSRQIVLESGRKLRADLSEPSEGFWQRVELLSARERMLIELALRGGRSHRQIAELLGRTPGSITRALQRLSRRLYDPLVLMLLHPSCGLEPIQRQIGVEHYLCGMKQREIARKHALPMARVRQILGLLKMWHGESANSTKRAAREVRGANQREGQARVESPVQAGRDWGIALERRALFDPATVMRGPIRDAAGGSLASSRAGVGL